MADEKKKKISWALAVAHFGEDEAYTMADRGMVEESPETKRYGKVFPFYDEARVAAQEATKKMSEAGIPGRLRVQYVQPKSAKPKARTKGKS